MNTDTEYSESQITLMVPDLDAAVSFYTTTLVLRLKARYGTEFAR
jgi:catechol 2,3-dioxygenase-like lactoylglutathione lyase family enzyme